MKTKSTQIESARPKTIAVEWTESEWFQVWLKLARRDYQGDPNASKINPAAPRLTPV